MCTGIASSLGSLHFRSLPWCAAPCSLVRAGRGAVSVGSRAARLLAMAIVSSSPARLLAEFVSSALSSHLLHDDRAYDTLLAQLNSSVKAGDSAAVSRWLHALAGCSSAIAAAAPDTFTALLHLLLDDVTLHSLTVDSLQPYCDFLVDFATAAHTQRGAAEVALRKLIDALHYAPADEDGSQQRSDDVAVSQQDSSSSNHHTAHTLDIHMAAHAALKRYTATLQSSPQLSGILIPSPHTSAHPSLCLCGVSLVRLLPSSLTLLWSLLVDCFPHSRQSTASIVAYVGNLLLLSDYCPTLRERVLTAITERLTQLDVEITAAQQQQQQQQHGYLHHNTMAEGLVSLLDSRVLESDDVRRLDALLCLLMRYIRGVQQPDCESAAASAAAGASTSQSAGGGSGGSDEVFFSLLRVFSVSILPTHRVQLVPFVLFYVCSLSHTYAESFLRWLLERAFDESVQPALRVSCVSYVQSFVARAAFLRHVSVALTFRHMLEWTAQLSEYTELQWRQQFAVDAVTAPVPAVGPLDAPQFGVFYSCFQCVLYIVRVSGQAVRG